jgi:hypothetical protein
MIPKLKYVYVLFLIIVVSILVFIVQDLYHQETKYIKPVEFNRIDGYNEAMGNLSRISVRINNDEAINHNYTIQAMVDSTNFSNEYVDVSPTQPFTYSIQIPTDKKFVNASISNEPVHNISLMVYRDDKNEPLDQIEFVFNR